MSRVRIRFSKTSLACFISHTDLPMLFARAARRAGLKPELTQGFSPHPRLMLAPPLPVGVVGLCEPADFWFEAWGVGSFPMWKGMMPRGIDLLSAEEITNPQAPSLTKLCVAAAYRIEPVAGEEARKIAEVLAGPLRDSGSLLDISADERAVALAVRDLERNGPSALVRILKEAGVVSEWSELAIARTAIGGWDEEEHRVLPV